MPVVQNKYHTAFERTDQYGNYMRIAQEPQLGNCRVYIRLQNDREKCIAELDRQHRLLLVKRIREKHYHRVSNSYGFNWCLINEELPVPFTKVLLIEHDGDKMDYYVIPKSVIKMEGFKLSFFAKSGFELQWFLKFRRILEFKNSNIKYIKGALVGDLNDI